jgi:hypothetical protein
VNTQNKEICWANIQHVQLGNGDIFVLCKGNGMNLNTTARGLRQKVCLGKQPSCTASSNINWCHLTQQLIHQGNTSIGKLKKDTFSPIVH